MPPSSWNKDSLSAGVRCVTAHRPIRAANGVKKPSTIPARRYSGHSLSLFVPTAR